MNVSHEIKKDFSKKLIAPVFHMKQSGCKGKRKIVFHVKHMLKCLWSRLALKVFIFFVVVKMFHVKRYWFLRSLFWFHVKLFV